MRRGSASPDVELWQITLGQVQVAICTFRCQLIDGGSFIHFLVDTPSTFHDTQASFSPPGPVAPWRICHLEGCHVIMVISKVIHELLRTLSDKDPF